MDILVFNSGSTSIKIKFFQENLCKDIILICAIDITNIFTNNNIRIDYKNKLQNITENLSNYEMAVERIIDILVDLKIISDIKDIDIIAHRIVHGGIYFSKSTIINKNIIEKIKLSNDLAPLHNPYALKVIEKVKKLHPKCFQTCTFDTGFHRTIPKINSIYPIPLKYYYENIKKYGAHGISYRYVLKKAQFILNKKNINVIAIHLGGGASICAIKNSLSLNNSMGLTPLGGLMMATRSGDLDPSIINYVINNFNINIIDFYKELNEFSGLLGISEISSSMEIIIKKANAGKSNCKFAIDLYCKIICDYFVTYQNILENKIDAIFFTGGIGQNSDIIRQKIINGIFTLNLSIDQERNKMNYKDYKIISDNDSVVKIYCIKTNEEEIILEDAIQLFNNENN